MPNFMIHFPIVSIPCDYEVIRMHVQATKKSLAEMQSQTTYNATDSCGPAFFPTYSGSLSAPRLFFFFFYMIGIDYGLCSADPKNSHMRELEGAKERLTLCRADLLDCQSLREAIYGCDGVFHTACPVTDDPEQMLEPAIIGTKNVIIVAAEAKVRRVVFTSSICTVYMNLNKAPDKVVDETCWSDLDFCEKTKNWYCYGKIVAEKTAWNEARKKEVNLIVINPVLVLGPLLQSTVNASVLHILKYLTGSAKTYANSTQAYVHVKDVALAHIIVYETPSASGLYICAESVLHRGELVKILAKLFPEYPIPIKCSDDMRPRSMP
ncbi:hypothetical protein P3S67_005169 [Capsicum chacoense]